MDLQGWSGMGCGDGGEMNQRKDNRRIGGIGERFTRPPLRRLSVFPRAQALEPKYVQGWGRQELWSLRLRDLRNSEKKKRTTHIEAKAGVEG